MTQRRLLPAELPASSAFDATDKLARVLAQAVELLGWNRNYLYEFLDYEHWRVIAETAGLNYCPLQPVRERVLSLLRARQPSVTP